MPLTLLPLGRAGLIRKVNGRDETRRFLQSLGFTTGSVVTMVQSAGDNVIIGIRGTRVAISKGMAARIEI